MKHTKHHHTPTAIIIGAGIAGIATAIRLAVKGFHVNIFEKNGYAGGKMNVLEQDGYRFDAGPSILVQPEKIAALFELAGEPMEAYLQYEALPVSRRYFYEDGKVVDAYVDKEKFATEAAEKLGEDREKLNHYLHRSEALYNNVGKIFLQHSLQKARSLFRIPLLKAIASARRKYIFSSMHAINSKSFIQPHTAQLFDRYATYSGSNPYKAPGMLTMMPFIEFGSGVYYPKGGMSAVVKALQQLAEKKGVRFHFNTPVQRIIHFEDKIKGVVVNETNHYANIIVSNVDAFFTYKTLLNDARKVRKLLKQERSSSAVVFYWGMKQGFPQLQLHNVFFSKNYQAEFDAIFHTKSCYKDPSIHISITSKQEPGVHAPHGKENWCVTINTPCNSGQNWEAFIQQYKQSVIEKLSRLLQTDIAPLIETEIVMSPLDLEANTAAYCGSLYGNSSNKWKAAFLRQPNFTSDHKGLYFVGGTTHPGGGIPFCLQGAAIASEMIGHDIHKFTKH